MSLVPLVTNSLSALPMLKMIVLDIAMMAHFRDYIILHGFKGGGREEEKPGLKIIVYLVFGGVVFVTP